MFKVETMHAHPPTLVRPFIGHSLDTDREDLF